MSTPLRLNNQLLTEAREAGTRFHRSITHANDPYRLVAEFENGRRLPETSSMEPGCEEF
jgi:hypothetical protein